MRWTFRKRLWGVMAAGLQLWLMGCGGLGDRDGYTACGDFMGTTYCQPGQYCVDAIFSKCEPGCTSSVNCARTQVCIKDEGQQVGRCLERCATCTRGNDTGDGDESS